MVFNAPYFENERGDPMFFFCFCFCFFLLFGKSDRISLPYYIASFKKNLYLGTFLARTSLLFSGCWQFASNEISVTMFKAARRQ